MFRFIPLLALHSGFTLGLEGTLLVIPGIELAWPHAWQAPYPLCTISSPLKNVEAVYKDVCT